MRRQVKRACAGTIAAAAAVALAAGMTSPAQAKAEQAAGAAPASGKAKHRITLITGDRVAVDAKGRVLGLEPAEGRAHIPVQIRKANGHTLVVPADVSRMIATGKVDRRLFDVTELNKAANRKAQQQGLKVIVGYRGTAGAAKAEVRDAGKLRRSLTALNADAVQTPKQDAADLWSAVTDGDTTASGIAHIWLDGVRKASLDKSVPQIGAPAAWAAGYDGKGVKIAVLDTGVDATHPDLKGQVTAAKNFSTSATTADKYGHGTHVASIAAGTGAKSGGKFKGVAPGATLLNGKVLSDDGYGDDSGIIAGMEWAAQQGADVINLSLGGTDTPGIDPLEAEVNKLSEEKGILFAIAAGNEGEWGDSTVGSPGSAASALTVGAVDVKDKLASFSSRGPTADGAIKPDVTAPGVDITAAAAPGSVIDKEVGQNPAGYLTISGTSMATPHVAGAAALLKQQHPDWGYTELKAVLTGSAKGGAYTPYEQGSGRVQVDKAIKQTVIIDGASTSVDFGVQQWPHTDDTPVTKQLTYRNLGTEDVTLSLKATGTNPKGQAAPAGFFTLGSDTVTVPAGGTASVDLTVDTRLGGTVDGGYSAYVTATGGGQTVRTAAAVQREVESYDLTLKFLGRDGKPTKNYDATMFGVSGLAADTMYTPYDASGTVKVRLPKGGYTFSSYVLVDPRNWAKGADWLAQPKLTVSKSQTVTLDARKAKPVTVTVPASGTKPLAGITNYDLETRDASYGFGLIVGSWTGFRSAHLGPQITDGSLHQQWMTAWTKGSKEEYDTVSGGAVKQLATGYTKKYKASELATVKVGLGAAASGKKAVLSAVGWLPDGSGFSAGAMQNAPGTRTLRLSTPGKVQWDMDFEQMSGVDSDGFPVSDAYYTLGGAQTFKGGKSYTKTFNTAVFGPHLNSTYGLYREGNDISGYLPLFADGAGHAGSSRFSSVSTTLYRNGTKVGSNKDPLFGEEVFRVPAGDAEYKLTTSVKRSAKVAAASTRVDASWTFRSKKTSTTSKLPASMARFKASTGLDSKVTAGKTVSIPVTVEGAAKGGNLKSLAVYTSYDGGKTWKKATVSGGKIKVKNPAKKKSISFKAKITDKKKNTSTVTIYNAYYGK